MMKNAENAMAKRCPGNGANGEDLFTITDRLIPCYNSAMSKISGIYVLKNKITGKVYVGQTEDFSKRQKQHRNRLQQEGYRSYCKLYPAVKKYGLSNFEFVLIEQCEKSRLNDRERYWISQFDSFRNGYNATEGGNASISYWTGKKRAAETNEKIRSALTGRKTPKHIREKMRLSRMGIAPIRAIEAKKRPVLCVETGVSFGSILEAARFIKRHPTGILSVLCGRQRSCSGYTWRDCSVETIPQGSRAEEGAAARSTAGPTKGS